MKKTLLFVAVATLFIASCQKEIDPAEQSKTSDRFTFKASIEQLKDNDTKGTINASQQLVWTTGDKIGIYVNDPSWDDKNQPFTLSSGAGETSGSFAWDYTGAFSDNAAAAFYPWEGTGSDKNNVYDGTMYFKLRNAYWSYASGKMLTPLVASLSGSTDDIQFKHAGAAVKVTINNVPKRAHSIGMSVDGQQISGSYSINPANAGTAALALAEAANLSNNSVWLNIWNGSEAAWTFIFPVPELTKPKLSFQMYDDNNILVWSKNLKAQSSDLDRGDILVMPDLTITPYSQFHVSADWTLCGKIGGVDNWTADIPMYTDGTVTILKGMTFKAGDEFKIRKDKDWDEAYPGSNYTIAENCTKDVWFNNSTHEITLKDAICDYPAPKVTLYFGINSTGGTGIALSSSGLGASGWPGVTLTQREYINNKWYYKYEVDFSTVWGKTISASIVGIDSWNTNATSLDFTTIKTEYYFEATKNEDISQIGSRPSDPAHQTITIGTNLTDWAGVTGATNSTNTLKVESDDDNVYIYLERTSAPSGIWNGAGYVYLGFDLDNNSATGDAVIWGSHKYEFYALIYPFGGTSESPAFYANSAAAVSAGKNAWSSSPSGHAGNISLYGVESSGTATFELSIPRNDIPDIPASNNPITVGLLGSNDFSAVSITHKLK